MSTTASPQSAIEETFVERMERLLLSRFHMQRLEKADTPEWLKNFALEQLPEGCIEFEIEGEQMPRELCDQLETLLEQTKYRWYVAMFSSDFDNSDSLWRRWEEPSKRDQLRDMIAMAIAHFLQHYLRQLPAVFTRSSKLLAEVFLVVEQLGGVEAVLNEHNLEQLLLRLSHRKISLDGAQQSRLSLLLSYVLLPFEYYVRGMPRCNAAYVIPTVVLQSTCALESMMNRSVSIVRLDARTLRKLDVFDARSMVLGKKHNEVGLLLQRIPSVREQRMGIAYEIHDFYRSQTELLMHPNYIKRQISDIVLGHPNEQLEMFHRKPGSTLIGSVNLENAKRIDKYLRHCLPTALLWESTNDIFAFRLRNKADLIAPPSFMLLQKEARLPVTVCFYNCVLLNLGDGPIDLVITSPESFSEVQKQMFVELHRSIHRCNIWFDSAWCIARNLPVVKLRLWAGQIAVLPIGSCYCVEAVRDTCLMSWGFVGCSLECLQELMGLVDRTSDYKRKEVLLEALGRYRKIRRRKECSLLQNCSEDPDKFEAHEVLLEYVEQVVDNLEA